MLLCIGGKVFAGNSSSFHEVLFQSQKCCYECSSNEDYDNEGLVHAYSFDKCFATEFVEQSFLQNFSMNFFRVRKGLDVSTFFKNVMQLLSEKDYLLTLDKSKLFYSSINHNVLPACQYYVFAVRQIII